MITRRNWVLRCSVLINIAVFLYICSHMMIGSNNLSIGPSYMIQEDYSKSLQDKQQQTQQKIVVSRPQQQQQHQQIAESVRQLQQAIIDNSNRDIESTVQNDNSIRKGGGGGGGVAAGVGGIEPIVAALSSDLVDISITQEPGKQQQQQQPKQIQQQIQEITDEDTRFVVPTIQPIISFHNNNNNNNNDNTGSVPTILKSTHDLIYNEVNYINGSTNEGYTIQNDEKDLETRLKLLIKCHNKGYVPETVQRGDFWVLKNYIRADHNELRCFETITYTTHADYTFLDNLIPLLERWNAPVSIALHAPGTDFIPTIKAIKYLRDCAHGNKLVRQFTTFHIYFSSKHIPKFVPKYYKVLDQPYNCTNPPPFANVSTGQMYKTQKKLLYPVNVGRNIARDAAMTHFLLASDIELYPNPGLVRKFLEMIARNDLQLQHKNPKVFPLSIFEVDSASQVPHDKTELQELLKTGKAIPFHKRVCASCHGVPKSKEWMAANETEDLGIFHIGKRVGYFVHWEPIYIGTHADPHYDERLSWEGKSDKMTQGYALCVLDYEFHILDNAFMVHKPGIKVLKKDTKRAMLATKTNQLIKKIIYPELQVMYGTRKGCAV